MAGLAALVDTQVDSGKLQMVLEGMLQTLQTQSWHKLSGRVVSPAALGRVSLELFNPGSQPVSDPAQTVYVCLDGEIQNYQAETYKKKLIAAGYKFRHHNDTELALYLYQEYGDSFANDLSGTFTIIIWDSRRQRLVVVVDGDGSRPVYYLHRGQNLMVASEIKAIICDPTISREVDQRSLMDFLLIRHILGNKTPIQGIKVMPPGGILIYEGGQLTIRQYWQPPLRDAYDDRSEAEHVGSLTRLFLQAMERSFDGNLPIGLYLSGGVDSRLLAAGAAAIGKQNELQAITRNTKTGNRDSRFAGMVTEALQLKHHFVFMESNYLEQVAEYGVWVTDGIMSARDFYVLSTIDEVAEIVKVIFFGVTGFISGLGLSPAFENASDVETVAQLVYNRYAVYVPEKIKSKLFTKAFLDDVGDTTIKSMRDCVAEAPYKNPYTQAEYSFLKYRLPRSSLQGLQLARIYIETRNPYYDRELNEYICQVPPQMRMKRRMQIAVLREINPKMLEIPWQYVGLPISVSNPRVARFMRGLLRLRRELSWHTSGLIPPPTGIDQADYHLWFANELRPWLERVLLSERAKKRGYFQPDFIKQMITMQARGQRDFSALLGLLLTVELWSKIFIDGEAPKRINQSTDQQLVGQSINQSIN